MAKKTQELEQQDMFPADPCIVGLGIAEFKVKEGQVIAALTGATCTTDIAQINDECWKKAIADWLVELCGNRDGVQGYIDEARAKAYQIERDREAMRQALTNVKNFTAGAPGALA